MSDVSIVKVGGSLYDLPDLGARLTRWLHTHATGPVLLVPGGGAATDVIRAHDLTHQLGAEASHWLALHMLQVNAHLLERLLPKAAVVTSYHSTAPLAILDPLSFARLDESSPDALPHTWDVTSDSLALRVAQAAQAHELVLLKSVTWDGADWGAAARAGVVDAHFPQLWRKSPTVRASVVNLRIWTNA